MTSFLFSDISRADIKTYSNVLTLARSYVSILVWLSSFFLTVTEGRKNNKAMKDLFGIRQKVLTLLVRMSLWLSLF